MCKLIDQTHLSGEEDCQIYWCHRCGHFILYYKRVCFSFCPHGIHEFKRMLENLEDAHFQYFLRNEKQVLIKNYAAKSGFFLNAKEVAHMIDMIEEAEIMLEVHSIIYS